MPQKADNTYWAPRRSRRTYRFAHLVLAGLLAGWNAHPANAEPAAAPANSAPAAKELDELRVRLQTLETQVAQLRDSEEIRALRQRYHAYVNEGQHALIGALFSQSGVVDFGDLGRRVGREAIELLFAEELIHEDLSFIKQFNHNHAVELEGDRATGFSYLEAKNVLAGEATRVAARYDDTYVRTTEGWRFQKMALTLYFVAPFAEGWEAAADSPKPR